MRIGDDVSFFFFFWRRSARVANQLGTKRRKDGFTAITDADIEAADNTYQVDTILDHRLVNNELYYLVKWKYYQDETWEPSNHLDTCPTIVDDYWRRTQDPQTPVLLSLPTSSETTTTSTKLGSWKAVPIVSDDSPITIQEDIDSPLSSFLLYHTFVKE